MAMHYENTGTLTPVQGFTAEDWEYIDGIAKTYEVL